MTLSNLSLDSSVYEAGREEPADSIEVDSEVGTDAINPLLGETFPGHSLSIRPCMKITCERRSSTYAAHVQKKHESENGDGKLPSFAAILRLLAWDVSGVEMMSYSLNKIKYSSFFLQRKRMDQKCAV